MTTSRTSAGALSAHSSQRTKIYKDFEGSRASVRKYVIGSDRLMFLSIQRTELGAFSRDATTGMDSKAVYHIAIGNAKRLFQKK